MWREWHTAQQERDHLNVNFAILEDGFESDCDDDLEPQLLPQEQENNNIDLRNVIMEDEEEAENAMLERQGGQITFVLMIRSLEIK